MSTSHLKEKLHWYIDNTDEVLLAEIYKMISADDEPFNYSIEDIEHFYKRRNAHLKGEGKSYTVDEFLTSIRKNGL